MTSSATFNGASRASRWETNSVLMFGCLASQSANLLELLPKGRLQLLVAQLRPFTPEVFQHHLLRTQDFIAGRDP